MLFIHSWQPSVAGYVYVEVHSYLELPQVVGIAPKVIFAFQKTSLNVYKKNKKTLNGPSYPAGDVSLSNIVLPI